jgi:hypothetical protein
VPSDDFGALETRYGLPAGLLSAVMKTESRGNPQATSPKGAAGRFQFMPATASQLGIDPRDTNQDAEGAARLLSAHMKRYGGNLPTALAAWNFGPGNLAKGRPLPSETQGFIGKVMNALVPPAQAGERSLLDDVNAAIERKGTPAPKPAQTDTSGLLADVNAAIERKAPRGPMPWSYVAEKAITNLPSSTVEAGKGILSGMTQLATHPLASAQALWGLAQQPGKIRDAIMNRYGSMDAFKQTLSSDPAGTLLDASTVLSGVGMLPKMAKVGEIGRAIDPIQAAVKGAGAVAEGLGKMGVPSVPGAIGGLTAKALGTTTGVGESAMKEAWKGSQAFKEGMRGGEEGKMQILQEAHDAITQMREERGAQYRRELSRLRGATDTVDKGRLDARLAHALKDFGAQFVIDRNTGKRIFDTTKVPPPLHATMEGMLKYYRDWTDWTPAGLDQLKKNFSYFWKPGEPSGALVTRATHILKGEIVRKVPQYATMTRDYEAASGAIQDIEKALSLRQGAAVDTAFRKISTLHRDVNRYRLDQMRRMDAATGGSLAGKTAGAAMSDVFPRGQLSRLFGGGEIAAGMLSGHPATLLAAPLFSPRLMGEAGAAIGPIARQVPGAASAVLPYDRLMYELNKALADPFAGQ